LIQKEQNRSEPGLCLSDQKSLFPASDCSETVRFKMPSRHFKTLATLSCRKCAGLVYLTWTTYVRFT
jgi:hypothetical protein